MVKMWYGSQETPKHAAMMSSICVVFLFLFMVISARLSTGTPFTLGRYEESGVAVSRVLQESEDD
jgi:hypothetical protein